MCSILKNRCFTLLLLVTLALSASACGEQNILGSTQSDINNGKTKPGDGQTKPGDGQTKPGDGQTKPGDGQTNPEDGQTNPEDGQTNPEDGQTNPEDGQTNPEDEETPLTAAHWKDKICDAVLQCPGDTVDRATCERAVDTGGLLSENPRLTPKCAKESLKVAGQCMLDNACGVDPNAIFQCLTERLSEECQKEATAGY